MEWLKRKMGRFAERLGTCRYCILVILVGVFLLLLPSGGTGEEAAHQNGEGMQELFDLEVFERKLEQTLSQSKGAGNVRVVLSLDGGSRRILAQDQERDGEGGGTSSTVTLGKGTGGQSVVPLQTMAPAFRGALVVCEGGGSAAVRLELSRAISALTGLGADCISICEGNP